MDATVLTAQHAARLVAAVAVTLVGIWLTQDEASLSQVTVAFTAVWVLCLLLLASKRRGGVYRASASYLILFGLFHGGLLISIALRGPDGFTVADDSWIYHGYTTQAVHLAIFGMIAFTLAANLLGGPRPAEPETRQPEKAERWALAVVGLGVQLTGVVIFAEAVLRAGGLDVLSGGYLTYVEANRSETILAYGYLLLGIGPVLAVVAGGKARVIGWTVFAGYAVIALLIGNRGEVLFPLIALMVIEARRGRAPRMLWTVLGSVGVLVVIGVIRQTRLTGLSGAASLSSPLDAMAEMGFSLRPATVVLGWHSSGEPFRGGETLVAVPLRLIESLTGRHGALPTYDDRLFNVEIMERVGPIGGSPIAEGYHNFGMLGVVLFMAAVGFVLALVERAPRTPRSDARIGIVLLPLLSQIRNSFAPVPVQLLFGFLLLGLVYLLVSYHEKQNQPLPAHTPAKTG